MRPSLIALTLGLLVTTASGQTGLASVEFDDQTSDGTSVVVQQVTLSNGGFVVIHDERLEDGDATGSVVGSSGYLNIGTHDDVQVNITLQQDTSGDTGQNQTVRLFAMPHFDSNDNEEYDFVTSNGTDDGPYTNGGAAVLDEATVTIQDTQAAQPGDDDEVGDPETDTPGLGILATVGLLGALAVARRRS